MSRLTDALKQLEQRQKSSPAESSAPDAPEIAEEKEQPVGSEALDQLEDALEEDREPDHPSEDEWPDTGTLVISEQPVLDALQQEGDSLAANLPDLPANSDVRATSVIERDSMVPSASSNVPPEEATPEAVSPEPPRGTMQLSDLNLEIDKPPETISDSHNESEAASSRDAIEPSSALQPHQMDDVRPDANVGAAGDVDVGGEGNNAPGEDQPAESVEPGAFIRDESNQDDQEILESPPESAVPDTADVQESGLPVIQSTMRLSELSDALKAARGHRSNLSLEDKQPDGLQPDASADLEEEPSAEETANEDDLITERTDEPTEAANSEMIDAAPESILRLIKQHGLRAETADDGEENESDGQPVDALDADAEADDTLAQISDEIEDSGTADELADVSVNDEFTDDDYADPEPSTSESSDAEPVDAAVAEEQTSDRNMFHGQPIQELTESDKADEDEPRPPSSPPTIAVINTVEQIPAAPPVEVEPQAIEPPTFESPEFGTTPHGEFETTLKEDLQNGQLMSRYEDVAQEIGCKLPHEVPASVMFVDLSDQGEPAMHAMYLAARLAVEDLGEILMIDADFASKRMSQSFELDDSSGLAESLTDGSLWQQSVRRTSIDRLSILPAGRESVSNLSTMAAGFPLLVNHLRQSFRLVLVNAGTTAEPVAAALTRYCDMTYALLNPDLTDPDTAAMAVRRLRAVGGRLVGAILT